MKLGFAALIEGSQLTGTPAALASGESSVFAALLGEELATVPKTMKGAPRQGGHVPMSAHPADADANSTVTGEMIAAAGAVPMIPQAKTSPSGFDVFDARASASTLSASANTQAEAPNSEPVQMQSESTARPVIVPSENMSPADAQSDPIIKAGDIPSDSAKTVAQTPTPPSMWSSQSSAPVEQPTHHIAAQTAASMASGQRTERAPSVGERIGHAVTNVVEMPSSATNVTATSHLAQATSEAITSQTGLASDAQASVQTVTSAPVMASVQTSVMMAAAQAPKVGKGEAVTTAPVGEASETVSVAAISASGEAKPTGSVVAQQNQSSSVSPDRQTTQQPQMVTPQSQSATPPLNGQAGQDGFELLPQVDADGLMAETAPDADTNSMAPQSLRADAKAVEAAAQNAVRNSAAPQMAGLVSRVGEQFLQRFNGKTSSFEIRLDPPELGKVDIRVEVGADGKVMAVIAARDPSVVDALLRGAKTLENALTEAGLSLDEGGIQVELDQKNSSSFADAYSNEFADEYPGVNGPAGENLAEAGPDSPSTPVIQSWSRHRLDLTA